MRRPRSALAVALLATMALAVPVNAARPQVGSDSTVGSPDGRPVVRPRPAQGRSGHDLCQDASPPTARRSTSTARSPSRTAPSSPALRNDFKAWLQANAPKAQGHRPVGPQPQRRLGQAQRHHRSTRSSTAPQASHVEYEGLYQRTADDPDLALINGVAGWGAGGAANAGEGRQGRDHRLRHRRHASLLQRRRTAGPDPARRPPLHEQQGHRRARSSTTRPRTRG